MVMMISNCKSESKEGEDALYVCVTPSDRQDFEPLVNKYAVAGGDEGGMFVLPTHSPGVVVCRLEAAKSVADDSWMIIPLVVCEAGLVRHEDWGYSGRPHIERTS